MGETSGEARMRPADREEHGEKGKEWRKQEQTRVRAEVDKRRHGKTRVDRGI